MKVSKISVGIMCWKHTHDGYKVLIERKRCTYAFIEFAHGHYNSHNETRIKYLLNNMTVNEKIDILSLEFGVIWHRVWLYNPENIYTVTHSYRKKAQKFNNSFVRDGGVKLRRLLADTSNIDTDWEFPKGRKKSNFELDVQCAIREFREETNIKHSDYKILFDIDPITYSHSDQYVNYVNKYYTAIVKPGKHCKPKIIFECKDQLSEVDALRWTSLRELAVLDPTGRLHKLAKQSLKYLKQN